MHEIINIRCEFCGKPRQSDGYHGLMVCCKNPKLTEAASEVNVDLLVRPKIAEWIDNKIRKNLEFEVYARLDERDWGRFRGKQELLDELKEMIESNFTV